MSLKQVELRRDKVCLKDLTTLKIGGVAKYFFVLHSAKDLEKVISDHGNKLYILGAGSNLLVSERKIETPVIRLSPDFDYIKKDGQGLEIGAVTPIRKILQYCLGAKLGGFEMLAGIPAETAGLIAMNASALGSQISDCLNEVEIVNISNTKPALKRLKKKDIQFGYRTSSLQNCLITRAWFCLKPQMQIKQKIAENISYRTKHQELLMPTCGCIFKNPLTLSAGKLLDGCGVKGLTKGQAKVSSKHANFIINCGKASYSDVDYLIKTIAQKVYAKHNIILEEEIKRWI